MRVDAEVTEGGNLALPFGGMLAGSAMLAFVAANATSAAALSVAALMLTTSFVALVLGALRRKKPVGKRRIYADARGLSIDGELVAPRQAILSTRVLDEGDGKWSVLVESRGLAPSRVVHLESARIAQALADTLSAPANPLVEVTALPPWAHRMRWLAIILTASPWILFNALRYMPPWSIAIVLGLYGVIALPMLLPQRVAIGDDGILLRWAGRRRFIPFANLTSVHTSTLGIELELADGTVTEIRLSHRASGDEKRRLALVSDIEAGLAKHHACAPAEDESLLTRGERDLDLWLQEMALLGETESAGYRTIAMPRDRLWAVLENPGADLSARQGAAIALRAHLDDDERDRLGAILQKSASPRLRIALDAVARSEDTPKLRIALEAAEDAQDAEEERLAREPKRASAREG